MPIYEFYCADCHTVFSFLSRRPEPAARPACPRCGRERMERKASRFAVSRGRPEPPAGAEGELADLDEDRLERAMGELAREAEGLNEEDPRQMARLMRKLYDSTGLQLGEGMEQAIRRMEQGEDPDKIEEDLGDLLEQEDPFGGEEARSAGGKLRAIGRRLRAPAVDDTLYEL